MDRPEVGCHHLPPGLPDLQAEVQVITVELAERLVGFLAS